LATTSRLLHSVAKQFHLALKLYFHIYCRNYSHECTADWLQNRKFWRFKNVFSQQRINKYVWKAQFKERNLRMKFVRRKWVLMESIYWRLYVHKTCTYNHGYFRWVTHPRSLTLFHVTYIVLFLFRAISFYYIFNM